MSLFFFCLFFFCVSYLLVVYTQSVLFNFLNSNERNLPIDARHGSLGTCTRARERFVRAHTRTHGRLSRRESERAGPSGTSDPDARLLCWRKARAKESERESVCDYFEYIVIVIETRVRTIALMRPIHNGRNASHLSRRFSEFDNCIDVEMAIFHPFCVAFVIRHCDGTHFQQLSIGKAKLIGGDCDYCEWLDRAVAVRSKRQCVFARFENARSLSLSLPLHLSLPLLFSCVAFAFDFRSCPATEHERHTYTRTHTTLFVVERTNEGARKAIRCRSTYTTQGYIYSS